MSELSAALRIYGVTMSASGVGKWVQGKALPNAYHLIALCYALKIEDGVSFFTRQYAPALNNEGIRKVQEYREDLVASGRYKPQVNAGIAIEYVDMPIGNLAVSAGPGEFLDDCNFQRIPFPKNSVPADADLDYLFPGTVWSRSTMTDKLCGCRNATRLLWDKSAYSLMTERDI